jgi:flagellar motor switch protein FliG
MSLAAIEVPRLQDLTGPQRTAILVMYLERPTAKAVLSHFDDDELQLVGEAMATIDRVPAELVEGIVTAFVRDLHEACLVPSTGTEFVMGILPGLVDERRRPKLMSGLRRKLSTRLADEVRRHPARTVAAILRDEHPQTRAVALLLMGEDQAADVLKHFDDAERNDLAMRMARIERLPSDLVDEVEDSLLLALENQESVGWVIQGVDRTAKILGRLNPDDQAILLEEIAGVEPELSETLRKRMVVFDDLGGMDDRSMQAVLKSIERDKLVIALRGAPKNLLDLVLRNMSSRAAADLAEEIDVLGPKPKNVVEAARDDILQTVLKLKEEGVVTLAIGGGGDML